MKYIIKKYYESPRNPEINQTTYLKDFKGGKIVSGEWTLNENEAFIFDNKSHGNNLIKLLGSKYMTLIPQ